MVLRPGTSREAPGAAALPRITRSSPGTAPEGTGPARFNLTFRQTEAQLRFVSLRPSADRWAKIRLARFLSPVARGLQTRALFVRKRDCASSVTPFASVVRRAALSA